MTKVKFVGIDRQYLRFREEILDAFDAVSRQGVYVLGDRVASFESNFARFCGTRFAVGVGNGSDALYLSLLALGIGPGDEVVTCPNSFVATLWAIARTGARVVFSDAGEDMNLDPGRLEASISHRTRAIVPVHLTGRIADMDAIEVIARRHGLSVIEDAAQAAGAVYRGRRAGSFGACAGFSLHPLKNLHVHGDGGVITTADDRIYGKLVKYRNHGLANRDVCEMFGINSRLDAVQAAIADIKLRHLEDLNRRSRSIAQTYTENLKTLVCVPSERADEQPVYHRYMIRHPNRDRLMQFLYENGIETKVNYPIPLHLQPATNSLGYRKGDFPVAEALAETILSLPLYPELTDEEVGWVIEKIKTFCNNQED